MRHNQSEGGVSVGLKRVILSGVAALLPGLAHGQAETGEPVVAEKGPPKLSFSLTGRTEFGMEADIDGGGDVSTTRVGADLGLRYRANDRVTLSMGFGAEYSFYDFDGYETVVGGGEPIDDAFLYSLTPTVSVKANDRWTLIGGGIFRWAGESGADLGDAFTVGGLAAANYRVNDRLSLGFGFIIATRLEDDEIFIPALTIDWKINDKWTLSNDGKPGLALKYQATERLELSVEGSYTTRDYRLDDNNAIPGGAMEDTRVPVFFAAEWRAMDRLTLTGRIGTYAYHRFEFRNDDGNEVDDIDVDPSLFVGFEARISF